MSLALRALAGLSALVIAAVIFSRWRRERPKGWFA